MSNKYLDSLKKVGLENLLRSLPSHVTIDLSSYVDTHTKARFIDAEYGEFWALPTNVTDKYSGHPQRGMKKSANTRKRKTLDKFLPLLPSHVKLDESTFNGLNKRARFIDEVYGEWWTLARSVLERGCDHPKKRVAKIRATFIKKYGSSGCMADKTVFGKSMKSMMRAVIKTHWKTKEEITCVASFESFVVDYLNEHKIDFEWQSRAFEMPDGRTYRPDMYLSQENIWVEIKGVFWRDAKEKWDWFHETFANSEIWDEKKLKSMGFKYKKKKA